MRLSDELGRPLRVPKATMSILIVGGSGFIGSRLVKALRAQGEHVMTSTRTPAATDGELYIDFSRAGLSSTLVHSLRDIEVVVNAVGILRERGAQTFEQLHWRGPQSLFDASAAAGVRRIIQISALGAAAGRGRYFTSKQQANEYLAMMDLEWTIIEPAIVYGRDGRSAALFTALASLPLIPVPGSGKQRLQPVHIDDVTDAIVAIICQRRSVRQHVPLAGPRVVSLREFLAVLRTGMRLPPARFVGIPLSLAVAAAHLVQLHPRSLLGPATLSMLEAGNTGDPDPLRRLLGRPSCSVDNFIDDVSCAAVRLQARLGWIAPLLRLTVAIMWIWTAAVSLGLYPTSASYDLLARVGVTGPLAALLLYGAAMLDLSLGIATLMIRARWLWAVQVLVIALFTTIISIGIPEYWLHPFGPIVKNLPLMASIGVLWAVEEARTWNT